MLGRRVKIIMAEFKQLADEVNAFIDGTNGHLVVGCAVAASAKLLPMTLNALKARVPDVLVTIREVHSAHLYAALSMGELDIVVGRLPEQIVQGAHTIDGCALRHEILFEESMCLVGGVRHWSAGGALPRPFDLQDIGKAPWILPVPESPSRMAVENYFRRAGLPMPRDVIESPSMLNNIGLMLETPRIALMSRSAIKPFAEAGLLCILAEDVAGSFGAVGFSVRADRALKPSCQIFIECLRQVATQA